MALTVSLVQRGSRQKSAARGHQGGRTWCERRLWHGEVKAGNGHAGCYQQRTGRRAPRDMSARNPRVLAVAELTCNITRSALSTSQASSIPAFQPGSPSGRPLLRPSPRPRSAGDGSSRRQTGSRRSPLRSAG
ncbi:hypothetical protein B2J93_56 [Marssonina coronariae]|uniref:Uncharacterized protein n=1 Tax=Diplocarpon coronariae TaxID=2795749 RepID=A0A218Z4E9_9HELO|nr:hypothetical protein B2J93_56 [Marssonina coronariae]